MFKIKRKQCSFKTDLAIRDTSFITSLKMTAAGVKQFFLVDEIDKPQQSMTAMEPSFPGMKIRVIFDKRGAGSKFFMSQDGSSLIDCFFEKVTARKNKQDRFFQLGTV